jgi:hypothetical protein
MRIMGIDSDKAFGWALYDTDKPASAIESGSLNLTGDDITELLTDLRVRAVPLVKELQPDFVGIEDPMWMLKKYPDKGKKGKGKQEDMLSPLELRQAVAEGKVKPQFKDQSPTSAFVQHEIAGGITTMFLCWNIRVKRVAANTWQTVIPASIRTQFDGEGASKKRAQQFCNSLKIQSPNQSSRDACLIALWTAGHAQELKMIERARQTA